MSEDEKKKPNRTLLLIEGGIALLAVIVIVAAIIINQKKAATDTVAESVRTANTPGEAGTATTPSADGVDNSAAYALTPALPEVSSYRPLTEEEAAARVADGTMLRLEAADGSYVYVNNYRDSELLRTALDFNDAELDDYIATEILAQYSVTLPVERDTAQLGDIANIDYVGTKDGVAFDGGTAAGYDLALGSGTFIPGFEDGVVGMKLGETKEIPLTFPENYSAAELAGQEVVFTVTLNSLSAEGYAEELTDAVTQELTGGDFTSAEEFRDYIRDEYLPQAKLNDFILQDAWVSGLTEEAVQAHYEEERDYYIQSAAMYGMSLEDYASFSGLTLDAFLNDLMSSAPDEIRADHLYQAMIDNEIGEVTEEEIAQLAADYGYADAQTFTDDYGREEIVEYLKSVKFNDFMSELATNAGK